MDRTLIRIRKATTEDARGWYALGNKVWRDAYSHIFPEEVFKEKERIAEENIQKFDEIKKNNDEEISYVAEYNGIIVGIMHGRIKSSYEYFHSEYADLVALYVAPEFQGYGIGSKFRNTFEEWARKNGATKYVIGVLKENEKARKVYESWGGKLSEHEQEYVKLNVGYPEVFYTFEL